MLAIRLPEEIENRLKALSVKTGRSKSFYAREAILQHLDDLEDIYLAQERIKDPAKRWSLDDLEQDLDLDS